MSKRLLIAHNKLASCWRNQCRHTHPTRSHSHLPTLSSGLPRSLATIFELVKLCPKYCQCQTLSQFQRNNFSTLSFGPNFIRRQHRREKYHEYESVRSPNLTSFHGIAAILLLPYSRLPFHRLCHRVYCNRCRKYDDNECSYHAI